MTEKTTRAASTAATMPSPADFEALRRDRLHAMAEHLNATGYGASTLFDLATMFLTIKKLAGEDSHIGKLAGIGLYLAEDWGNSMDCQREEAQAAFDAVTGGAE